MILEDNNRPAIVKDISLVSFPNLRILIMSKNNIYNIESLARLHAPVLDDLHLGT